MAPGSVSRSLLGAVCCALLASCGCGNTPPFPPQEALKTFQLPPGFKIELVAAEPLVADPVAIAFDGRGRLLVLEMGDYPMQSEPQGRVVVLEDSGGGKFDRSHVYADKLAFPTGLMPWKEGVLVAAAPDVLYLPDLDGDLRADERRVILTGFNRYNPQLRVNGLLYGIDNWIYGVYPKVGPSRRNPEQFGLTGEPLHFPGHPEVAAVDVSALGTDFRFRPDRLQLEPVAGNSQYGNAFDASGNRFGLWNNNHIRHPVIAHRYLSRNPYLQVSSSMEFPSDHENQSIVYPITRNPIYVHESQVGIFTSSCGNSVYNAGRFPERLRGAYFVCDPLHNLVHCDLLSPSGATFSARRAFEEREFLASTDAWFKPVFTTVGPDGALYVVDYYRKYVEHPDYVPEDLEGHFDLRAGAGRGRIYRVVPEKGEADETPDLQAAESRRLVEALSHANMWWRITAQRLLVERQDQSVVPVLREHAVSADRPESRIHALRTLDGLGGLDADLTAQALGDGDARVREHAIRLSEQFDSPRLVKRLLDLVEDPDRRVQFQLACTLALLPESQSFGPLTRLLARHPEDRWLQIAVLTSASENAGRWLRTVTRNGAFLVSETRGKEEFLVRLAAILGARQIETGITEVLRLAASATKLGDEWWRSALLAGLGQGLSQGAEARIHLSRSDERLLFRLMGSSSPAVAAAALNLTDRLLLSDSPRLRRLVETALENAKSHPDQAARVIAVRILGLDPAGAATRALEELLTPQVAPEVQVAAARSLLKTGTAEVVPFLLRNWGNITEPVRRAAWDGFLARKEFVSALLDGIQEKEVEVWTLGRPRINQLLESPDEEVRRRAEGLFGDLSDGREDLIERYKSALSAQGEVPRGREIFRENCSRCHLLDGMGSEVGPDLLDVIRRPKKFFLAKILDPNLNIAPGYETYVIETRSGATVSGVIAQESPTSVTLRREEGEEETLLRSNIATLRVSSVSNMPEGLEEDIDPAAMADLLEYLQRLSTPGPM
jgi:putative membrane-bound dehydrogenase-like protein